MIDIFKISENSFEIAGTGFGFFASFIIGIQIYQEISKEVASSLSLVYLLGFLFVYAFWTLYGIRFKRIAIWLNSSVATVLQSILIVSCSI